MVYFSREKDRRRRCRWESTGSPSSLRLRTFSAIYFKWKGGSANFFPAFPSNFLASPIYVYALFLHFPAFHWKSLQFTYTHFFCNFFLNEKAVLQTFSLIFPPISLPPQFTFTHSQFWLKFTILTEIHNYNWNAQFWLKFPISTEIHNFDWNSQFQLNFTISTEIHKYDNLWLKFTIWT